MNRFKQSYRNNIMKKKRDDAKRIKKEFVDTGAAKNMMDEINKKAEPTISVDELPF